MYISPCSSLNVIYKTLLTLFKVQYLSHVYSTSNLKEEKESTNDILYRERERCLWYEILRFFQKLKLNLTKLNGL